MAQLLVRQVDEAVVAALKSRAAAHNRSAEAEHRAILEAALKPASSDFAERAAKLRAATMGRFTADSADLIREDRDTR
jgi:plasmid stability protein